MTLGDFIKQATDTLQHAGIESARLDVLMLLEDELGTDRALLLAHPEMKIAQTTEVKVNTQITQRSHHVPLAYIRGTAEFYGRNFAVTPAVLIPRPETEAIIDLVKKLKLPKKPLVADVGCGSGCIGITAKLELPAAMVFMYDIDDAALQISAQNARTHNAAVAIERQDLLHGINRKFDAVLANLPYVPDDLPINKAARYEPSLALFAGHDGMDTYRRFWQALMRLRPTYVITETLISQHALNSNLARNAGYRLQTTQGLVQQFNLSALRPKLLQ